jgi:hypothetical protein
VIHDLTVVAILVMVVSDLFTVLQSEVNWHHVINVIGAEPINIDNWQLAMSRPIRYRGRY